MSEMHGKSRCHAICGVYSFYLAVLSPVLRLSSLRRVLLFASAAACGVAASAHPPPPPVVCGAAQNVVSTVNLGTRLDLKQIAMNARNAEYNPRRFSVRLQPFCGACVQVRRSFVLRVRRAARRRPAFALWRQLCDYFVGMSNELHTDLLRALFS